MQPLLAFNLIKALGMRRKASGRNTYIIHVSFSASISSPDTSLNVCQAAVTSLFSAEGGWPYGEIKDSDPILEKEKRIANLGYNPVREVRYFTSDIV